MALLKGTAVTFALLLGTADYTPLIHTILGY